VIETAMVIVAVGVAAGLLVWHVFRRAPQNGGACGSTGGCPGCGSGLPECPRKPQNSGFGAKS